MAGVTKIEGVSADGTASTGLQKWWSGIYPTLTAAQVKDTADQALATANQASTDAANAKTSAAQSAASAQNAANLVGAPASAAIDAATPTLLSTNGSQIQQAFDARYITSIDAYLNGVTGDGTTDDTAALNACIQTAITQKRNVYLRPWMVVKVSDTITLGKPGTFSTVALYGDGANYRGQFRGPVLQATFNDRPIVNIQGGRRSSVRGIAIIGTHQAYLTAQHMGEFPLVNGGPGPSAPIWQANSWTDPGNPGTANLRYSPYAAITIDAYAGSKPAGSTYPGTYGQSPSSFTTISDVYISGVNTGIVNQPCDYDGNGDYTVIRDVSINYCAYAISFGNSQSRNPIIERVTTSYCHTVLTNRVHGRQSGRLGGMVESLEGGNCYQIYDLDMSYAGPTTMGHLTFEICQRVGNLQSTVSGQVTLVMQSAMLNLNYASTNANIGFPAWQVSAPGSSPGPLTVRSSKIIGYAEVFAVQTPYFQATDGTYMSPAHAVGVSTATGNPTVWWASNALAGGMVSPNIRFRRPQDSQFPAIHHTTGAVKTATCNDHYMTTTERLYGIPVHVTKAMVKSSQADYIQVPWDWENAGINLASGVTASLSGANLTLTFASRSEAAFASYGPLPGDVMIDPVTGTVFRVLSRSGLVVTATAVNNITGSGASATFIAAPTVTSGYLYVGNSRVFATTYLGQMSTTSGTKNVTLQRDDGWSGFVTTDLLVGDWLFVKPTINNIFPATSGSNNQIATIAAPTITTTGNATKTWAGTSVPFIQAPPANEATP